ncbi:hypothetical protein FW320_02700 [Azospirillum sp. Vi22]|nr:hypothetical protein [Azospirillum baldaniorum]
MKAVKECGGLVIVQDPGTAAFDGMPNSAIATGLADYVLAPERMADALIRYVRQPYVQAGDDGGDESDSGGEDLDRILELMQARSRHDYRAYKTRTLIRRIERRMGIHQIDGMRRYREFLGTHPGEVEQLSRDILISVTRFFRDSEAFEFLKDAIIDPLVRGRVSGRPIRVWVPGCATGEEVYSIAMLLMEGCAAANRSCDIKVFGTDIDVHALDVARTGVYPETIAVDVSADRLARFFIRVDAGYKVNRLLRETVTFAIQNMISDPPFSTLDLISCRNVLIYIDPAVQRSILELFHFGLGDGGGLFLGSAETIGTRTDLFAPLSKKWRLYRKLGNRHHLQRRHGAEADRRRPRRAGPAAEAGRRSGTQGAERRAHEHFSPGVHPPDRRNVRSRLCRRLRPVRGRRDVEAVGGLRLGPVRDGPEQGAGRSLVAPRPDLLVEAAFGRS